MTLLSKADRTLLIVTMILLALSVLMVFSTTAVRSLQVFGDSTVMLKKHIFHIVIGVFLSLAITQVSFSFLRRHALFFLLTTVTLLLLVLVPGIGSKAGGARRWISLGALRAQPAELCKALVIIYFAAYIDRYKSQMVRFVPGIIVPLGIIACIALLLLSEPDFGTTAVITIVVCSQLFLAARISHLAVLGAVATGLAALLVIHSPYRMRRLVAFMNPFDDPGNSGYQLIQSLIAVGSGGVWGVGLGAGRQKLFYLPAAHTDFIFAVVAEELGLVGAGLVLVLFMLILYRGIMTARQLSHDTFLCSLTIGITLLIVLPALLNIGVVTGMLPTKGLVLPLIAYGGSAMIVHLVEIGMLLRLSSIAAFEKNAKKLRSWTLSSSEWIGSLIANREQQKNYFYLSTNDDRSHIVVGK